MMDFIRIIGGVLLWFCIGSGVIFLVDWISPEKVDWGDEGKLWSMIFWPLAAMPLIWGALTDRMLANRRAEAKRLAKEEARRDAEDRLSLLELRRAEKELEAFLSHKSND